MWGDDMRREKQAEASAGEAVTLRLSPFHINGVGPSYTMKLAICGIETIGELLGFDNLEGLSQESTIPISALENMRVRARAMVENRAIQIRPFTLPKGDRLYLDIETTLQERIVWMIGFMADNRFQQLYADDYDDEKLILDVFSSLLEKHSDRVLVTWSDFDRRVLCERMRHHRVYRGHLVGMINLDLRRKVRDSFVFPTRGYGLKSIGSFLGYPFKNTDLNGLKAAIEYQKHVETLNQLDNRFFKYNEDDVRVLPFIEKWALNQKQHERDQVRTYVHRERLPEAP